MSEDTAASLPSPASNASNANSAHSNVSSPSSPAETPTANSVRPSSSRVLNPASNSNNIAPSLAIATTSSLVAETAAPSPVGGAFAGPTSTNYVIPPRPKPGRKPATDEPASKRKAQNRESQRAFRARKAAKLNEMKTQAEIAEMRYRQDINEKMMELADKQQHLKNLEVLIAQLRESEQKAIQERDSWKQKTLQLEHMVAQLKEGRTPTSDSSKEYVMVDRPPSPEWQDRFQTVSAFTPASTVSQSYEATKTTAITCGSECKDGGRCICLETIVNETEAAVYTGSNSLTISTTRISVSDTKEIPTTTASDDPALFAEREIDFTAQFATKKTRPDPRPSIAFLTQTTAAETACGFCTAESYCVCRDMSLQDMSKTEDDDPLSPACTRNSNHANKVPPQSTSAAPSGPGSCDACMRDPKQRAWCQRVAELKNSASSYWSPASTPPRQTASNDPQPMEPRANYSSVPEREISKSSIGCNEAYKLFRGRVPTDPDSMDWTTLKPISSHPQNERLPGINESRYSALELDTASVIATLQHAPVPLKPRKQDGAHADLVRIAEEYRRSSNSPRM
ncbi:uncharacterized protein EI97DRAFT_202581 [Westerdykella ornata]|uniref:BZIP domain-containing protein n=1 Tax=Westerdykella ornata TaxID=318751 RepID=A0A6A6JAL8_WESOR|nr:uncharacterized protein EI97DRAFT_202581 [Westerdykella ornata]KAF2272666.1 hypothetical protein EI97DRAFT_202581 [Westerdykella ornata]